MSALTLPSKSSMAHVRAWLLLLIHAACTPALALHSDQANTLSSAQRSGTLSKNAFSFTLDILFFAVTYAGDLVKYSVQQLQQCMLQAATL